MTTPNSNSDYPATRLTVNAPWLVKLRWVAVAGQLATIAFVAYGMGIELPLIPLASALAVTAVTNAALAWWVHWAAKQPEVAHRQASLIITVVMLLDLVVLSAMLFMTGGPTNPFIVFYFVNLALAGVLLEPSRAWLLEVVACLGMVVLFWNYWDVPLLSEFARISQLKESNNLQLAAMGELIALVAASSVIVWFMTRLNSELQASQKAREQVEHERVQSEKLEALGTLAAGAAHELATPLSTIAVVVNEMERELSGQELPEAVAADLVLMRKELERCRAILHRMSVDAGQSMGEAPTTITVAELADNISNELASAHRVEFDSQSGAADLEMVVPQYALAQALRGLVKNGLDASSGTVSLIAEPITRGVQLTIADQGPGMAPDVLARAGDPFFTTKQPGQGMGLGLYLARSVVERLGGQLLIRSTTGQGTQVVVTLPTND